MQTGEVEVMIQYIESVEGYRIELAKVKCKYGICYNCPLPDCKQGMKEEEKKKKREQNKIAVRKYRETHKDEDRERKRRWREKRRLAMLLDQQRQNISNNSEMSLSHQ